MEPLPGVFDMLQYFETILPSVESLWSSQQEEVYFMSGGAAGGLSRHQQMVDILATILGFTKNWKSGYKVGWYLLSNSFLAYLLKPGCGFLLLPRDFFSVTCFQGSRVLTRLWTIEKEYLYICVFKVIMRTSQDRSVHHQLIPCKSQSKRPLM